MTTNGSVTIWHWDEETEEYTPIVFYAAHIYNETRTDASDGGFVGDNTCKVRIPTDYPINISTDDYIYIGVARGNIGGDLNIYPVLKIINTNTASDTTGTVTITNHSTGAFIKLNHVLADGEVVTTDIKHRRIESSVHGDITDKISDDTVLANFFLQVGLNDLEFINTSIGQELNATATYNNEYFSAEV